jgi:hypothetical protein
MKTDDSRGNKMIANDNILITIDSSFKVVSSYIII